MRVAGPLLTLSALLIAAPALAQTGGYYDPDNPYNWDRFGRFEYYPPPERQMWRGPMYHGPHAFWAMADLFAAIRPAIAAAEFAAIEFDAAGAEGFVNARSCLVCHTGPD